jgi:hypothetical protein
MYMLENHPCSRREGGEYRLTSFGGKDMQRAKEKERKRKIKGKGV